MKKLFLLVASLISFTFSNAQVTLYLDAGHGGMDAGAKATDGSKESALCLEIAQIVAQKASEKNIKVVMIRNSDEYVTLTNRSIKTDNTKHAYFVSIHLNSDPNKELHGSTVIVQKGNQLDGTVLLSRKMLHHFSQLGNVNIEQKNLVILKDNTIPSVVVCPGYITNETDLMNLKSKQYQEKVVEKIIAAISE